MAKRISAFWLRLMVEGYTLDIPAKRNPTICGKCIYFDINADHQNLNISQHNFWDGAFLGAGGLHTFSSFTL